MSQSNLAYVVGRILAKQYPDHLWAVRVPPKQGVVQIKQQMLNNEIGYVLKIKDFTCHDTMTRLVLDAAGQMLERLNLTRGKAREDEILSLKRNARGNAEFQS